MSQSRQFPKIPKMPKRYKGFVEEVEKWCVEHHIAVVAGGGSLERYPTGTKLNAGSGGGAGEGGSMLTLYYIDGGTLMQADFEASNITAV